MNVYDLRLDDDLKALISLTNGNGQLLTAYKLVNDNPNSGGNVIAYSTIHISVTSGQIFYSAGQDPVQQILVEGRWGYGGQWVDGGQSLTASILATDTTMVVTDGTQFEVGMVLKLTTTPTPPAVAQIEYLYVAAIPVTSGGNVTVVRGYNNSTPIAQSGGTECYYWQALDSIRDIMIRLVQWKNEQRKSPLAGQITIGDFNYPVNTDGLPKDIYLMYRDAALYRLEPTIGV